MRLDFLEHRHSPKSEQPSVSEFERHSIFADPLMLFIFFPLFRFPLNNDGAHKGFYALRSSVPLKLVWCAYCSGQSTSPLESGSSCPFYARGYALLFFCECHSPDLIFQALITAPLLFLCPIVALRRTDEVFPHPRRPRHGRLRNGQRGPPARPGDVPRALHHSFHEGRY